MSDKAVSRTSEQRSLVHVVVVLNYKGRQDTLDCIEGIVDAPGGEDDEVRIVLVDNGSDDRVIDEAVRRWPDIDFVQSPVNLGFAGGMNAGLRKMMLAQPSTLTVLNNDTHVTGAALVRLGRLALERGAAVSPTVFYLDRPEEVWFAGGVLDSDTFQPRHMTRQEIELHDSVRAGDVRARQVDVLAGCCITAPLWAWRSVGLFDEKYFLNFEDSDWSLRARSLGVPLLVDKDVSIWHKVSASFKNEYSFLGHFYYSRNGLLFRKSRKSPPRASLKFLRRNVLPAVKAAADGGRWGDAVRLGVLTVGAILQHGMRSYGKAPRWAEKLSQQRRGR